MNYSEIILLNYKVIFGAMGLYYSILFVIAFAESRRRYKTIKGVESGISILKPIKGLDDQLLENLESFFNIDYKEYEIIFGVQSKDDPAIKIIRDLQIKYPLISSKLVIDNSEIGLNPKINNLSNILPKSRYSLILISDSNTRVNQNYLSEMVSHYLRSGVGLVTSTIRGSGARTFGAIFENLHLNTFIMPNVFCSKKLIRLPMAIGKSMLLNKSVLNQIGGLQQFKDVLAEDHLIGKSIAELGYEVFTTFSPVENINITLPIKKFLKRHLRWAKMRWQMNRSYYLLEPFTNPVFMALIYFILNPGRFGLYFIASVWLLKSIYDYILGLLIKSDLRFFHYLLTPFKDMLITMLWIIPFFQKTIEWRGNELKITRQTRLLPLKQGVENARFIN